MSIWNGSPQRELTTNPLSGKLGADQHDITIRVAKQAGRHPDPAAFAAAASQAAAGRDASILSAHTANEIICVVSVATATGPQAVAVALAVVADALSAEDRLPSPSR
jgi:hypothetical protein